MIFFIAILFFAVYAIGGIIGSTGNTEAVNIYVGVLFSFVLLIIIIALIFAHNNSLDSWRKNFPQPQPDDTPYKDIHAALTHKDSFTRYPVYDLSDLKRHVSELYTVNSFSIWDAPFYKNEPQRLRFNRAKYQTITFLVADPELNAGICMSTRNISERYMVTLVDCTCEDFKKHAHPCKHMYALALKLGVIDKEYHL